MLREPSADSSTARQEHQGSPCKNGFKHKNKLCRARDAGSPMTFAASAPSRLRRSAAANGLCGEMTASLRRSCSCGGSLCLDKSCCVSSQAGRGRGAAANAERARCLRRWSNGCKRLRAKKGCMMTRPRLVNLEPAGRRKAFRASLIPRPLAPGGHEGTSTDKSFPSLRPARGPVQ